VITGAGRTAFVAGLAALVLAVVFLSYLLLVVAVASLAFIAFEVGAFHRPSRRLAGARFHVTVRDSYPRLPIGTEGPVRLAVRYEGPPTVPFAVVDTLPASLGVRDGSPVVVPPTGRTATAEVAYRVHTGARGRHDLGPTMAVRRGALDLAFDEVEIAPARPLLVTASNLSPRSVPTGLGLYTRVRGRLALRHRGYGSEFRSLRAYELSDDIRHVAWRRSTPENLLVREFEQESRQDYLLVFDVSPPMNVGPAGRSALDLAAEAGAIVAGFVERSAEDRIGLLTYAGGVHQFFRPARGSAHFRRIAENLALAATRDGPFDLAHLLIEVLGRLRVHTHLLVFSTLSEPLGDLHTAHSRFIGRGHHLYLFAAQASGFHPPADDPALRDVLDWAESEEERRLARRLALLHAEGVPTYRYDRLGAAAKVVAAYGAIRAWGRAG